MTTIYKYTNTINGKVYVGKTDRPLNERHREHKYVSKIGNHHWANAIKKWGLDSFDIEILCEVSSEEGAFVETAFIAALKSTNRYFGYNGTDGGEGVLGYRHSEETKTQIRRSVEGRRLGYFSRHPIFGKMPADLVLRRLKTRYGANYVPRGESLAERAARRKTPEQLFASAQAGWVKRKRACLSEALSDPLPMGS